MPVDPTSMLPNRDVVIPAELRADTPEKQNLYKAALEFERVFVQQMLKDMDNAAKMSADGEEASGATSGYSDMAKDGLTDAVLNGGGLGLASTLYGQLVEQEKPAPAPADATAPADGESAAPDATEVAS